MPMDDAALERGGTVAHPNSPIHPNHTFDRDIVLKTALSSGSVGFTILFCASLAFTIIPVTLAIVLADPAGLIGPAALGWYIQELAIAVILGIVGFAVAAALLGLAARVWYRSPARIMLARRAALAGALAPLVGFLLLGVLPGGITLARAGPVSFETVPILATFHLMLIGAGVSAGVLAIIAVLLAAIPSEEFARNRMPYEYRSADPTLRIPERTTHERRP